MGHIARALAWGPEGTAFRARARPGGRPIAAPSRLRAKRTAHQDRRPVLNAVRAAEPCCPPASAATRASQRSVGPPREACSPPHAPRSLARHRLPGLRHLGPSARRVLPLIFGFNLSDLTRRAGVSPARTPASLARWVN